MTIPSSFLKVHGMGNDFVAFVDLENSYAPSDAEIKLICDRHFGIGGDGLIRIGLVLTNELNAYLGEQNEYAHNDDFANDNSSYYFMDYYNADGSVASMCGNGIRCVAKVLEISGIHDFNEQETLEVATRAGLKQIHKVSGDESGQPGESHEYNVDMGVATLNLSDEFNVEDIRLAQKYTGAKYINIGNDHLVVEVSEQVLAQTGNLQLTSKLDANIELINVNASDGKVQMRVQERGVGETLSCGTGICAAAIYATQKYGKHEWDVEVPGGVAKAVVSLELQADQIDSAEFIASVTLQGPANYVGRFEMAREYFETALNYKSGGKNAH